MTNDLLINIRRLVGITDESWEFEDKYFDSLKDESLDSDEKYISGDKKKDYQGDFKTSVFNKINKKRNMSHSYRKIFLDKNDGSDLVQ